MCFAIWLKILCIYYTFGFAVVLDGFSWILNHMALVALLEITTMHSVVYRKGINNGTWTYDHFAFCDVVRKFRGWEYVFDRLTLDWPIKSVVRSATRQEVWTSWFHVHCLWAILDGNTITMASKLNPFRLRPALRQFQCSVRSPVRRTFVASTQRRSDSLQVVCTGLSSGTASHLHQLHF